MDIYQINDAWNEWNKEEEQTQQINKKKIIIEYGFIHILKIYFQEYYLYSFIFIFILLIFSLFINKK